MLVNVLRRRRFLATPRLFLRSPDPTRMSSRISYSARRFDSPVRSDKLALYGFIFSPKVFLPCASRVCHRAHDSRALLKRVGRFFKIRFQRHDRSPFSIMPTYTLPEVPTNVSLRSECSRCLLSKTERWLTIFLDWYVFEPNVKSNLTLALSFFSLSHFLFSGNDHE